MTSKSDIVLIYTLFGSAENARAIPRQLIEERLIACANRFAPVRSTYMWEGELREEEEHAVLLKSVAAHRDDAMDRLRALHPYETPAVLSWSVERDAPDYARWIAAQTAV